MDFTHSASLPIGVFYQGQLHRDFTVRVSTVGDEIAVVEDGIPDSGTAVGVLARCITALGSIPAEDVTYQLLCDTLVAEDYKALRDAQQEAKKKLSGLKSDSVITDTPSSDLASTATAKSESKDLAL
ncbi:hypothetical protein BMF90_07585 [Serratia sp. OLHL2]|uniref:hypothetical protein n=1 Tax=Serratia TaxID=613 RepID=UPI000C19A687|nr:MULTISPECIES: hypothetical protein [unclassified Serratia (in: enterobacteria)]PII53741.1 hypothetical protein BMF87_08660 [Serratia sp. OLEL1]PII57823.1 hypothetical protein BMF85_12840 [Serratia sp. OLCL1]PII65070.1 hypothetical protein BMF92_06560 [Serratia sp. OLBL1]PII65600.1 hypothetical protein BMF90_07585 [Serratia sp. OLHL2]PII69840.1 hypothetical protein BMF88_23230 [Serratia sp. OLDL1]